jgi:deoxycytidylate deaminase
MNAILQAGRDAKGGTLYMYGFRSAPCRNCTKHLIAAGVIRVVGCGIPTPERWQANLEAAESTLAEADIGLAYLEDLD